MLRNLNIGMKIAGGYGIILVILLGLSVTMMLLSQKNGTLRESAISANQNLDKLRSSLVRANEYMVTKQPDAIESARQHIDESFDLGDRQVVSYLGSLDEIEQNNVRIESLTSEIHNAANELSTLSVSISELQSAKLGQFEELQSKAEENLKKAVANESMDLVQRSLRMSAAAREQMGRVNGSNTAARNLRHYALSAKLITLEYQLERDAGRRAEMKDIFLSAVTGLNREIEALTAILSGSSKDVAMKISGAVGTLESNFSTLTTEIENLESATADLSLISDQIAQTYEENAVYSNAEMVSLSENSNLILLVGIGFTFLVSLVLTVVLRRNIGSPIIEMTSVMNKLATGDSSIVIPETSRSDEIGKMRNSLVVFRNNAAEMQRLEEQQRLSKVHSNKERAEIIRSLSTELSEATKGVIKQTTVAASQMSEQVDHLNKISTDTVARAESVRAATAGTNDRVEVVSSAIGEISKALQEISMRASQSSNMVDNAVSETETMSTNMNDVMTSSQQVQEVMQLVQGIAAQTNMLALNATIEAARAGDAGKGFSVVANEVKSLANQTANATNSIQEQVDGIDKAIAQASSSSSECQGMIHGISEFALTIATSIEEQSATTDVVNRNILEISEQGAKVTESIDGVNADASEIKSIASGMREAVESMNATAEKLEVSVTHLLERLEEDAKALESEAQQAA